MGQENTRKTRKESSLLISALNKIDDPQHSEEIIDSFCNFEFTNWKIHLLEIKFIES